MSLPTNTAFSVPENTATLAKAILPNDNIYLQLHETLGSIYNDKDFADLFPTHGQPAHSPARLALVTILQFLEDLSDRAAADAVRTRIDWKYLLGLELTDRGFDHTVLSEFRSRLVAGSATQRLLDLLLAKLSEGGWLKTGGKQRTDSTPVLAAVWVLNRLERVGETLRHALNILATVAPEWLQPRLPFEWWERYSRRMDNYHFPKAQVEREKVAALIGEDGFYLLKLIEQDPQMAWLKEVSAVQTLKAVWEAQYIPPPQPVRWRELRELAPAAQQICSPYDTEARFSVKHGFEWVGYKVHLTETCEEEYPNLIVDVTHTSATVPDDAVTLQLYEKLAKKQLLPTQHLVDGGYTDTEILMKAKQNYQIELVAPIAAEASWQARAGAGFSQANFQIDWEAKKVTCPAGKESRQWKAGKRVPDRFEIVKVRFAHSDCTPCQLRTLCTKAKSEPRELGLQLQAEYEAVTAARIYQTSQEFQQKYNLRAGAEGTISQIIRRSDLRQARYKSSAKVELQEVASAAAVNLIRMNEWLLENPRAKTRVSAFATLKLAA